MPFGFYVFIFLPLSFVFRSSLPLTFLLLRHDMQAHERQDLYRLKPEQAKKPKKRRGYLENGKEAAPCPLAGAGYAARLDSLSSFFFNKIKNLNFLGANK
ncbi:hypothetical protein CGRA01v4_10234 [Colletotrichum graminicola]|nr:hypothetical protein CGRA01v4_10234 [Colletotrichum graminicola]